MSDSMMNRLCTMLLVLTLLIGLNSTINVSAGFVKYDDQGIWIDEFDDLSDVTLSDSLNHSDDKIILKQGEPVTYYNHSSHSDNIKVWTQNMGISEELLTTLIKPDIFPGDQVTENLNVIDKLDDKKLETLGEWLGGGTDIVFSPLHHFQFKINQKVKNVKNITIEWWYGEYFNDANLKEVSLWVWNYGNLIGSWVKKDTLKYNETNIKNQEASPDLSTKITGSSFIDDDGYIDIVIKGTPKDNLDFDEDYDFKPTLHTDWIEVEVSTEFGYLSQGVLTSTPITPPDFGGWENIFWKSTKTSKTTEIVIEVLDEFDNLIKNYKGESSPIDISSIKNTTIKLRAKLYSYSPDVTPSLDNWGITWQRDDGYRDSFTHTYRIEELEGAEIQGGNIKVNEFYSDWELFGKNPANTRSHDGQGLTSDSKKIYWRSKSGIGGEFRQIVSTDGKVFVPSSDKKIYSFNSTKNSGSELQYPADNSKAKYIVQSCIGASGNYLIIGACESNAPNKLYALSTSNLSLELWNYSAGSDPICFSSAPTIYDGKVYITSCSGMLWDIPLLSFFNEFLDRNNKLIALDLSNGEPLWDSIDLPAASLSSPAIGDNMVFVGCQNMWGSSLFAYNIDTGEEVWNTSVGIIGRSSVVYNSGKVFVVSRAKENVSSLGTNQLVAINAETGEELYNISIGDDSFTPLRHLARGFDFYTLLNNYAPISSPAYYDETLYILTQDGNLLAIDSDNGKTKWSFDLDEDDPYSFYVTSPVVVSDIVYVINGDSKLYAFNTENQGDAVDPLWTYQINKSAIIPEIPKTIASPIVNDGLLMISCMDSDMTGRIYSVGEYSPNYRGTVISKSIHLPSGYWWNTFNATYEKTYNNTIELVVLDNGDEIKVNGSNNDLSGIKSNVIRLKATLNIKNSSEADPVLKNWSITWKPEGAKPVFDTGSFKPGQDSWTNELTPTCSIEVEDKGQNGVFSGLDIDSAEFRIDYKEGNEYKTSDWFQATSENESGVTKTTIYADIGELDIEIDELINLTFRISDLAGNSESYNKYNFKFDFGVPTSEITGYYSSEYRKAFNITAKADDPGNKSGVYSVKLQYRYRESESDDWSSWLNYGSPDISEPYKWEEFEITPSGYYQVVSIAKDKADNQEIASSANAISFKFDMVPPKIDSAIWATSPNVIPRIELTVSDDLELDSIEYSYNQSKWIVFEENIGEEEFSTTWIMEDEDWDEMIGGDNKTVYFRITDACGNERISDYDDPIIITKGENASSYYIDVSDFSNWHWDNKYTISVKFPEEFDVESVDLYYKYSKNDKDWPENYTLYDDNKSNMDSYKWTITPPKDSGYYKFRAVITDTSGEVYEVTESVSVTMFPTNLFLLLIVVMILLVIVGIIAIVKMKRKKRIN